MITSLEDRVILILNAEMFPSDGTRPEETEEGVFAKFVKLPAAESLGERGRGFWEKLAERTGIGSQRWRSVYTRRQRPTPHFIEALARLWPCYGFWLATGLTDAVNGHVAPRTALSFPERLYGSEPWSDAYFETAARLVQRLSDGAGLDNLTSEDRMHAVSRKPVGTKWIGGELEAQAYDLAKSEDYAELVALWEEREKNRPEHVGRVMGTNRPWERKQRNTDVANQFPGPKTQSHWDLFYKSMKNEKES